MFGEYELLVWVLVGIGAVLLISRFVILPFTREMAKAGRKKEKIDSEELAALNVKKIGGLGGDAIAAEVDKWITGLEMAHKEAMKIYSAQKEAAAGLTEEERKKVLLPLESKIRQIEFFMTHKETLKTANKVLTAPIIGKWVGKLAGGFL